MKMSKIVKFTVLSLLSLGLVAYVAYAMLFLFVQIPCRG